MIIGIISPNNASVSMEWVKCMLSLKGYDYYFADGCSLPTNRNRIFQFAKEQQQHLMFIDTDMIFTPQDIVDMERHLLNGLDVVCGSYVIGTEPYPTAVFGRITDDYELIEPQQGLYEIDAGGTGFMAISNKVIQTLDIEPFNYIIEREIQHGDDISFCYRVNEAGFKIWCDNDIQVGHLRNKIIYANRS